MERDSFLMLLVLMTLLAAIGVGFYQLYSVDEAKKKNSHTALRTDNTKDGQPG